MAYVTPKTWAFRDPLNQENMNTYVRDQQLALKALIDGLGGAGVYVPTVVSDPRRVFPFEADPDLQAGMDAAWPAPVTTWDGLRVVFPAGLAAAYIGFLVAGGEAAGYGVSVSGSWSGIGWRFVGDVMLGGLLYKFYVTIRAQGAGIAALPFVIWRIVMLGGS